MAVYNSLTTRFVYIVTWSRGVLLWFFPLFVWGWLLTPSSEDSDSSLVLPHFRLFVWGCSLSLSSSDSQWLLHLLPPWHLEEQVAPFFRHTQRWVVHPVLQLQQLDWKSFWGLTRWAASRKESTRSSCQPFTISSRSPWNGSRNKWLSNCGILNWADIQK